MGFLTNWFKQLLSGGSGKPVQDDAQTDRIHNSATIVTARDLIKLQGPARKLNLTLRSYARASTTGSHHSRFRGRGMDYQESRIYQPGDDIRSMDWRVTARAGKPHTKLYQEERERPVMLLVDFNPGMFFASVNALKSVQAARTAALLGWAAAQRGDRIGALVINGARQGHKELPPKTARRGTMQLIHELVEQTDPERGLKAAHSTHLNEELQRLRRISRPGSLVFIISDFYDIDDDTGNQLSRLSHHNDLVAIRILDPLELHAPPPGRYPVTNGEVNSVLDTVSKTGKSACENYFQQQHQAVTRLMHQRNIPLLHVLTSDDPASILQQHFGTTKRIKAKRKLQQDIPGNSKAINSGASAS